MNQNERISAALTYELEGNTVRGYDEKHRLRRIFSVSDKVAKKLREQAASEAATGDELKDAGKEDAVPRPLRDMVDLWDVDMIR